MSSPRLPSHSSSSSSSSSSSHSPDDILMPRDASSHSINDPLDVILPSSNHHDNDHDESHKNVHSISSAESLLIDHNHEDDYDEYDDDEHDEYHDTDDGNSTLTPSIKQSVHSRLHRPPRSRSLCRRLCHPWCFRSSTRFQCCKMNGIRMKNYKYFLFHLLIFNIIALIIIILLFYIIIPIIIRHIIHQSTLSLINVSISEPNEENLSIFLSATTQLDSHYTVPTVIHDTYISVDYLPILSVDNSDSENPIISYGDPLFLASLPLNSITIDSSALLIPSSSLVTIPSLDAFNTFTYHFTHNFTVTWRVRATLTLTPYLLNVFPLPTYEGIPMEKIMIFSGCNGFNGVGEERNRIVSFDLLQSDEENIIATSNIIIYNPTVFNIYSVGTLSFMIYYQQYLLGTFHTYPNSVSTNLTMGYNTITLQGIFHPVNTTINDLLMTYYLSNIPFPITAITPSYNASSDMIYSYGMRNLTFNEFVNISHPPLFGQWEISSLHLVPSDVNSTLELSSLSLLEFLSPVGLNSPLTIHSIRISKGFMLWNEEIFGVFSTDWIQLDKRIEDFNVTSSYYILPINATVTITNPSLFSSFLNATLYSPSFLITLYNIIDNNITYCYGNTILYDIPITINTTLTGMNGLSTAVGHSFNVTGEYNNLNVNGVDDMGGFCDPKYYPQCGITYSESVSLVNPSIIFIDIPHPILFNVHWIPSDPSSLSPSLPSILPIGIAYSPTLSLFPFPLENHYEISGIVIPHEDNIEYLGYFISDYLNGNNQSVLSMPMLSHYTQNTTLYFILETLSLTIHVAQPIPAPPPLISSMTFPSLSVDFVTFSSYEDFYSNGSNFSLPPNDYVKPRENDNYNENTTFYIIAETITSYTTPPALYFPFHVDNISFNLSVYTDDNQYDTFSVISHQFMNVTTLEDNHRGKQLLSFIIPPTLSVITNMSAFSAFSSLLLFSQSLPSLFVGYSTSFLTASAFPSPFSIPHLALSVPINFTGLNNFLSPSPPFSPLVNVRSVDAFYATSDMIRLRINVTIVNDGNINLLNLGTLTLSLIYHYDDYNHNYPYQNPNITVGVVEIFNVSLYQGDNVLNGITTLMDDGTPQVQLALDNIFSVFLTGNSSLFTMVGSYHYNGQYHFGTTVPPLLSSLSSFSSTSPLPGIPKQFILHFTVLLNSTIINNILFGPKSLKFLPTSITVHNQFSLNSLIVSSNVSVISGDLDGVPIGYWIQNRSIDNPDPFAPPIHLYSNSVTITPFLPIYFNPLSLTSIITFLQLIQNGSTIISINGLNGAFIGGIGGYFQETNIMARKVHTTTSNTSNICYGGEVNGVNGCEGITYQQYEEWKQERGSGQYSSGVVDIADAQERTEMLRLVHWLEEKRKILSLALEMESSKDKTKEKK